jgi:error-prone DNA polymerase
VVPVAVGEGFSLARSENDGRGETILLYPTDRDAYARLSRLLTFGKRRAEKGECHLTLEDVLAHAEGMLGVLVPPEWVGGVDEKFARVVRRCKEAFDGDRLSIAAARIYGAGEREHLRAVYSVAKATGVPTVATNRVLYHAAERKALQDVLTCVRLGCTVEEAGFALTANAERHMKGPEEMARLFRSHRPSIERTVAIAERAGAFSLESLKYEYPHEICPEGKTLMGYLQELTWAGAAERYPGGVPAEVKGRLEHEFELIRDLNYPAYFLTVHDIVRYARSQRILCQGRGAAANSAVCYCLGVTAVDPSRIDLLVERFISRERDEPPDIDIDFEHERREEVIQYIYKKFGRERAALTAEVITYRRRSAIRDVGKALGLSLDCVDRLAKGADYWDAGIVSDEQFRQMGMDPADVTLRNTVALAEELRGFPRHLSQHVGGFVITQRPLCEMVPIENASMPERTVIEWDKDDIDAMGMLKIDVLALGMLTAVSKAIVLINGAARWAGDDFQHEGHEGTKGHEAVASQGARAGGKARGEEEFSLSLPGAFASQRPAFSPLQFHTIPLEDAGVYDMLCEADSVGVFQVESRAQMTMLPRLRPRRFYDLVIEVAIVRPGPIQGGMVHPYLRRRNGEEKVEYPDAKVKAVLERTLGVPLFQEQAMRLAIVAAGFSAGEADKLRRAMAAWKRKGDLIYRFGQKLIDGMLANGYSRDFAERCFEQIKGFSEYGFPESHAASFAQIVYASAWIKRYHPAAFCAAILNSQPMGFYKPAQLVRDAQEHGVQVRPVDVWASVWDCTLEAGDDDHDDDDGFKHEGTKARRTTKTVTNSYHRGTEARRGAGNNGGIAVGRKHYGRGGPAVRLGLRMVKGLHVADAERVVRAVAERKAAGKKFGSVMELWRAGRVPVRALRALAEADAFGSLGLDRQHALWEIGKLRDAALPLLDGLEEEAVEEPLPAVLPVRRVVQDYASVGLSLKAHPLSFVRPALKKLGVVENSALGDAARTPTFRGAAVAGLVLVRQRPGTASGVVFITIEDETGVANLIVRPHIYERYKAALRHCVTMVAWGRVERQGQVVHVLVTRAADARKLLTAATVPAVSRDFH